MRIWLSAVLFLVVLFQNSAFGAVTVVLTRHGEVAAGPPGNPPLSPAGKKRAELLARMLSDAGVDAIWVTGYLRTQQTAEPTARLLHLKAIQADSTDELVKAIQARDSGTVLVVGHSNTLPALIERLGGPKIDIPENAFDNVFILTMSQKESFYLHLHYGEGRVLAAVNTRREERPTMEISFARSGGFVGPATAIEGKVVFDNTGAHVTSSGGYRRALTPGEAELLRATAEKARNQGITQGPGELRDGYQYDIRVTTSDGKDYQLRAHGESAAPENAKAFDWVRSECERIWDFRINQ